MYTVAKEYTDLPAAHRQPRHDGHCRLIHGHNWKFKIVFICSELDENGFVVDVGKLGFLKEWLVSKFDHTLLLNADDPKLKLLQGYLHILKGGDGFANIVVVPNCGMEGLALFVFEEGNKLLAEHLQLDLQKRGLKIIHVVCFEDSKNQASYFENYD